MESADLAARNFWGVSVPSALAAFARVLRAASGTNKHARHVRDAREGRFVVDLGSMRGVQWGYGVVVSTAFLG